MTFVTDNIRNKKDAILVLGLLRTAADDVSYRQLQVVPLNMPMSLATSRFAMISHAAELLAMSSGSEDELLQICWLLRGSLNELPFTSFRYKEEDVPNNDWPPKSEQSRFLVAAMFRAVLQRKTLLFEDIDMESLLACAKPIYNRFIEIFYGAGGMVSWPPATLLHAGMRFLEPINVPEVQQVELMQVATEFGFSIPDFEVR